MLTAMSPQEERRLVERIARLYELARRLARSTITILILGETGSGKELAAAAIHAFSARAAGPFVSVNCAAIPESLAESELFGHARGAFSGAIAAKPGYLEIASGGTVFLDEIGELPPAIQAKLLRVLESSELMRRAQGDPTGARRSDRDSPGVLEKELGMRSVSRARNVSSLDLPSLRRFGSADLSGS
jgi:DNA-binding NtrC family response regulator